MEMEVVTVLLYWSFIQCDDVGIRAPNKIFLNLKYLNYKFCEVFSIYFVYQICPNFYFAHYFSKKAMIWTSI